MLVDVVVELVKSGTLRCAEELAPGDVLHFFSGDEELVELVKEVVEVSDGVLLVERLDPGEGVVFEAHGELVLEILLGGGGGGALGEDAGFVVELFGCLGAVAVEEWEAAMGLERLLGRFGRKVLESCVVRLGLVLLLKFGESCLKICVGLLEGCDLGENGLEVLGGSCHAFDCI